MTSSAAALVELDLEARGLADVARVDDGPGLGVHALGGVAAGQDPDLLGPDREAAAVALEHVRDADEAGDELGQRALVDLGGRADLLDPARR